MHSVYSKGSEWRKWDLHVHTPASVLFHNFSTDWDEYVKILFEQALDKGVCAIGITDYYSIEGYKKKRREYLEDDSRLSSLFSAEQIVRIKQILVLPNIEFRLSKLIIRQQPDLSWNRKVNFHLLISDEVSIDDIEDLIQGLTFESEAVSGRTQKESLTLRNIQNLGERIQSSQATFVGQDSLLTGMLNIAINEDEIIEQLSNKSIKFKGKYLLGLPADEDWSEINWSSQGYLIRRLLIQKANFFFSSNANTRKFCLGLKSESEEHFIKEFNALKPCLWGSDAHDIEKLFEPDHKRYTWIKANPSFEGLKQVMLEPGHRVTIQPNAPSSKRLYNVIDCVRLIDNSSSSRFANDWIYFNDDLNVIIGGKSSGKSLLLYHVAKAVDPTQVDERTVKINGPNYSRFQKDLEIEVQWKNGSVDRLSSKEKHGKLTYLPQLYINNLAEQEGQTDFFQLIESILNQNEDYKLFNQAVKSKLIGAKSRLSESVRQFIQLQSLVVDKKNEIKRLTAKDDVQLEVDRLEKEMNELVVSSNLTSAELQKYTTVQERISNAKDDAKKVDSLVKMINSHAITVENSLYSTRQAIGPLSAEIIPLETDELTNGLQDTVEIIEEAFTSYKCTVEEVRKTLFERSSLISKMIDYST